MRKELKAKKQFAGPREELWELSRIPCPVQEVSVSGQVSKPSQVSKSETNNITMQAIVGGGIIFFKFSGGSSMPSSS